MKILDMKRLLSFVLMAAVFASCEKPGKNQPGIGGNIHGCSLSIMKAELYPLGETIEFVFASGDEWVVDGIPEWMSISMNQGRSLYNGIWNNPGTFSMSLGAVPNPEEGRDRECVITFRSGSDEKTVTITQPGPYLFIEPEGPYEYEYDQSGALCLPFKWYERDNSSYQLFNVKVNSNIRWTIVADNTYSESSSESVDKKAVDYDALLKDGVSREWVQYARAMTGVREANWLQGYSYSAQGELHAFSKRFYGENTMTVGFIPKLENTGESDDNILYRIIPDTRCNISARKLKFSQNFLRFNISGDVSSYYKADYTDGKVFTVNCEHPWKLTANSLSDNSVPEASDWLTMYKMDSWSKIDHNMEVASGVTSVSVLATPNPQRNYREGWMFLSMDVEGIMVTKPLTLLQEPSVFELVESDISIGNNDLAARMFNLKSTGPWKYELLPASTSWLNITANDRNGDPDISVDGTKPDQFTVNAVGQNFQTSSRIATVKLSSVNNPLSLYEQFTVTQAAFIWNASLSDDNGDNVIDFSARNNRNTVSTLSLKCSSPWEIIVPSDCDWLTFDAPLSGDPCETVAKDIDFMPSDDNLSDYKRTAEIIVRSVNFNQNTQLQKTFRIEQRGANFGLTKDEQTELTLDFSEFNAASQSVEVKSSHEWNVKYYPDWVEVYTYGRDSDGRIQINVANHYDLTGPRSGDIILECPHLNKTAVIHVVQDKFTFNFETESHLNIPAYVSAPNNKKTAVLNSSAGWQFDGFKYVSGANTDEWVATLSDQGTGNELIAFTISSNPTSEPRECRMLFRSNEPLTGGNNPIWVTFRQDGFIFETDVKGKSYSFGPLDDAQYTFDVRCNGPWAFSNKPSWVNLNPSSGTGDATVTLSVSKNLTTVENAPQTITLYNNVNSSTYRFTVSQGKYDWFVSDLNSTADLEALSPQTRSFTLTSSGSWTVKSNQAWAAVNNSGAAAITYDITAKFDENYTKNIRDAVITARSEDNPSVFKREFTIRQKAFVFDTDAVNPATFDALYNVNNVNLKAYVDVTMPATTMRGWTVKSSDSSWIKTDKSNGNGGGTVRITVENNFGKTERNGKVEIVSDMNSNLKKIVTVKQKGFEFDVTSPNRNFAYSDGTSVKRTGTVKCTGAWTITSDSAWLTVTKTSATGYEVSPKVNETYTKRTATVKIQSSLYPQYSQTISFSQDAKPEQ